MTLNHSLTPVTKINFNFKNLKIRPDNIKLLEENIGKNLLDIALAMIFFSGYDNKSVNNKIKNNKMGNGTTSDLKASE